MTRSRCARSDLQGEYVAWIACVRCQLRDLSLFIIKDSFAHAIMHFDSSKLFELLVKPEWKALEYQLPDFKVVQMASLKPSTTDIFYRLLLLLEALDPTRGERSKSGTCDDATVDHPSVRRSFVDSIAYICAYDKGPDHVTAAALQQTSQGTTIWLAGNKDVKQEVVDFLNSILHQLNKIALLDRGKVVDQADLLATGTLSSLIIKFLRRKLVLYHNKSVKEFIPRCLDVIDQALSKGTKEDTNIRRLTALQEWIKKFSQRNVTDSHGEELEVSVRECYDLRRSDQVSCFKLLGAQREIGCKDFQGFSKLIGKLAKPIAAARSLVTAALILPADFSEAFKVEIVPSSAPRKVPLSQTLTIEEILHKIFTSPDEQKKYRDRLRKLTNEESISVILERKCKFDTLVHAELLLLHHFYKQGYEFVARDKYIACSKHACYLCHAYIRNHPGDFTPPPTHHRIYKRWRTPNADSKDPNFLKMEDDILQMVNGQIKRDLLDEIGSSKPRRSLRAGSPPP